ncbi:hypothetical protein BX600DRAFT_511279 [Xylariales sp. PMI_506]|nr:hypothetical protein BX600DRAFT_511279 [Xylariales sp. PMI_506]
MCLFTHPLEEEKVEDKRRKLMLKDLESPSTIENAETSTQGCKVQGFIPLSSFNKISSTEIAVPGEPPRFRAPRGIVQVIKTDKDTKSKTNPVYRHAFQPLLRSVELMKPEFGFSDVDIVTHTGGLRRLFCCLYSQAGDTSHHRFDLQWQSGTLFMEQWVGDPKRTLNIGCTTGFLRKTTTHAPPLRDALNYYYVLSFAIGDLKCLAQSHADAYSCDCHEPLSYVSGSAEEEDDSDEELSSIMKSLWNRGGGVKLDTKPPNVNSQEPLHIRRAGRRLPMACLVNVKTRSMRSPIQFDPQMFFSRVTRLYEGTHSRGVFQPSGRGIVDRSEELAAWSGQNGPGLERFEGFLKSLIEAVRSLAEDSGSANAALVLNPEGDQTLATLYARTDGKSLVPESFGKRKEE